MPDDPILTLVSDGLRRKVHYRDPGTGPADAVIWLHGGDTRAQDFLDGIRRRDRVLDIAPQGLDNPTGGHGWVHPWEDGLPAGVTSNLVDVHFIAAVEGLVRTTFASVTRVWLCGFSAGGGLVWSMWAPPPGVSTGFSGLAAVGKQLHHKREHGWDWGAATKTPRPFALVHGMLDRPDDEPLAPGEQRVNYSWVDSYAEARAVNGNTGNQEAPPRHATCGGAGRVVRMNVASGGSAPSARITIDGVGHVWVSRPDCHTDDFVIERFTAWGLGA